MKKTLKIISVMLLSINGVGAIYGGLNLITDPSGQSIELPIEWMQITIFKNFLIPGIFFSR
jgi:hypothetical protein